MVDDSGFSDLFRKEFDKILAGFRRNPICEPFLEPVNWRELGLDDYPDVVKRPMDLSTIAQSLSAGLYTKTLDGYLLFFSDLYQIWSNCTSYNEESSSYYESALKLQTITARLHREFCVSNSLAFSNMNSPPRTELIKLCYRINKLDARMLAKLVRFLTQFHPACISEVDSASLANRVRIDLEGIAPEKFDAVHQMVSCLTVLQTTS